IYSYGHRNTQGLAFNPVTGDLWNSEFGPRGGDEINIVKPSLNYGWPTITYGIEYGGPAIGNPPIQQKDGLEQPVYYWDPVLSPGGMVFYTGSNIPEWKNNLFIGGLSNFASNRMVYWVFSEPVTGGNHTAVGKGKLSADEKTIEGATVIYQALPTYKGKLHYGGRIIFDKEGNLFVSTGERSDKETRPQAQHLNSALGKIVRITKDVFRKLFSFVLSTSAAASTIVSGRLINPFNKVPTCLPTPIYPKLIRSLGARNPLPPIT
ncbi:UNVERIFIED_CONTAM: yliI, partial [Trichonephila clavipes]